MPLQKSMQQSTEDSQLLYEITPRKTNYQQYKDIFTATYSLET